MVGGGTRIESGMRSYEEVFLAIAIKNRFLTLEEGAACINDFNAQPPAPARLAIEEFVQQRQLLTVAQARTISAAAQKVRASGESRAEPTPPVAAPEAATAAREVRRVDGRAGELPPAGASQEPIPGLRIVGKLGVGGTATIFAADDAGSGHRVALKVIHPSLARDEKAVRRFQREASLLISFDHPNIVKGHVQGMMGPLAYFIMEHLDGESAQQVLERDTRLEEPRALEIILETARAIDYMQSRGFVHRDIKPGNIMLLLDGRVKVLDLGFAQKITGEGSPQEETTSGTVQYMSPEQARGQTDLDVRADIYSLGATLYHMVMGELPFSGSDSLDVMAKQVMEALNSSEIKNRRISKHMNYFIERMMSKDKDLRYATPKELIDDINEQIEGFRSLQYRPDEAAGPTAVLRAMTGADPKETPPDARTTARYTRPGTRRMSKLEEITKRFKKR